MESRNKKILDDFIKYYKENPEQRFWQAIRNWSGQDFVLFGMGDITNKNDFQYIDTFYLEGKND